MKLRAFALAATLILSACSTTSKLSGEVTPEGVELAKDFGKVEVSYTTFGDWKSITSTASSNIPIQHDAGLEQAFNIATMRAKRNIVEFVSTDIRSKKISDTFTESMVDHSVTKDHAAKLSNKITESIVEESNGIVRGAYISKRVISEDGKNVSVTMVVDKKSLESAATIRKVFLK